MEITKIPNKILAGKTVPASVKDIKKGAYKELISAMKVAMKEHQGIGLAANQIDKDLSIFVIEPRLAEESKIPHLFIKS